MQSVVGLNSPLAKDESMAGGKAAGLARIVCNYPVPEGIVLLKSAFKKNNGLTKHALSELADYITANGKYLFPAAVRSSGIGEDGLEASFAGQHETILGVPQDANKLMAAIHKVAKSHTSERALEYRASNNIAGKPEYAVLIQRMVEPDYSVVAFSKNIANGSTDEAIVSLAPGTGEKIVSGACTPSTWIVDKASDTVIDYDPGEFMITQKELVERVMVVLAKLEQELGVFVDMEGAFRDDKFYLLQARPVTV